MFSFTVFKVEGKSLESGNESLCEFEKTIIGTLTADPFSFEDRLQEITNEHVVKYGIKPYQIGFIRERTEK